MENASTNVQSSASLVRQGDIEQKDDSPEQPLQVRPSQSERRPSVGATESAEEMPGFFESIADRFKSWKKRRNELAFRESGDRAVSTITRGLATDDSKKVYQGLKRLHNAKQKLFNTDVRVLDKKAYFLDALQSVVSECVPDEKNSNDSEKATNLKKFAEDPNNLVDRHSDSKTLFHRMLLGLERFDLISSSYVGSRTQRIGTQDNEIKDSLASMQNWLQLIQDRQQFSLLKTKADAGSASPSEMYDLGVRYRDGRGVDPNPEEAFRWFSQAADRGYKPALSAMCDLGKRYRDGEGVDQNHKTAASLFLQAADREFRPALYAMNDLGKRYRDGDGVDQNHETAVSLFQQAADRGYSHAMYELGVLHGENGDREEALKWFRKAADRGYRRATVALNELLK